MQQGQGVDITMDDVKAMLAINPLAAEQVKTIALQRQNAALEVELSKLKKDTDTDGKSDEPVPEKAAAKA